ncbi:MAG: WD40 repeat domain-containing protein [Muribaculaceae bacterium]|nr:WD40 repeat domain-containing protein [Muribaculaceae bacterium]
MKFHIHLAALTLFLSTAATVDAQTIPSGIHTDKNLFYSQPVEPQAVDNYLYSIYFSNGRRVYNLKGYTIAEAPADIRSIKVNPAGHSVAVLTGGKKKTVTVYDLNSEKRKLGQIKNLTAPSAIGYTADARLLAVADGPAIRFYDARTLQPKMSVTISSTPDELVSDHASDRLAAISGTRIEIVSPQSSAVTHTLNMPAAVSSAAFDQAGSRFGVTTADGKMSIFDAHSFGQTMQAPLPAAATALSFHPDGKYVAAASSGNRISFINLIDKADTLTLLDPEGHITDARFIRDGKNTDFIAYTAPASVKYKRIAGFAPNYTKMLEDELNARMLEWTKMKPMETEEDYALRVNDETKARQKKLFANEIATSLAGDLISHADVTLGGYNPETNILTLNVGGLPAVYLTVSQEEAAAFGDGSNLEFRNAVYGLTPDDTFELIYADVYNPTTGKTYRFDNLDRQSLDFLATDDSFISLDLIRKSSREDARLQDIKTDIIEQARGSSSISEHTHIDARADIISDFDASGRRINNYKVDFTYTVDPDFSAKEDFAPGKYRISDSPAAESMLAIVRKAFATDFAGYVAPGKRLIITMTGTADALPIGRPIAYDGSLGEFDSEPCRIDGNLSSVSVNSKEGISTNEQLAFMRAQGVRNNLLLGIPALADMDVTYNYAIEVSKEKGGAHRRINVSFVFVDAF